MSPNGTTGAIGPSWKWMVGILLSVIGIVVMTGVTVIWDQISLVADNVQTIRNSIVEMQGAVKDDHNDVQANHVEIQKIEDRLELNERTLLGIDYRLKILENDRPTWIENDRLLHNWVHPDDPNKRRRVP